MPRLILNAEKDLIDKAKQIAEERGTSVSALFSQYVKSISTPTRRRRGLAPITRKLRGLAKASSNKTDRELFEAAISAKGR